jgi:hypothetical protein
MEEGEIMTAEQKVKAIYPAAVLATLRDTTGTGARSWVYSDASMGKTELLGTARRGSWAWAAAWRKIEGRKAKGASRS